MEALEDLTKLVNFQQVSSESVEPEPSDRKGRVIFDIENIRVIAQVVNQVLLSEATAQLGEMYSHRV